MITLRATYFPMEGQYLWSAWEDGSQLHMDYTFHDTREQALVAANEWLDGKTSE